MSVPPNHDLFSVARQGSLKGGDGSSVITDVAIRACGLCTLESEGAPARAEITCKCDVDSDVTQDCHAVEIFNAACIHGRSASHRFAIRLHMQTCRGQVNLTFMLETHPPDAQILDVFYDTDSEQQTPHTQIENNDHAFM